MTQTVYDSSNSMLQLAPQHHIRVQMLYQKLCIDSQTMAPKPETHLHQLLDNLLNLTDHERTISHEPSTAPSSPKYTITEN